MSEQRPRPTGRPSYERSSYERSSFERPSFSSNRRLYRRDSNMSNTSFVSEVEMAHDEVFAGPMSESVPSSNTGFAHRHAANQSVTSFTYYPESADSSESLPWPEDDAVVEGSGDEDDASLMLQNGTTAPGEDQEMQFPSSQRRKSSGVSRMSVEDPLLARHDSAKTDFLGLEDFGRTYQKFYVANEDLTIVIAGFKTSKPRYLAYLTLCIISCGLAYLLFRWMPRLKVRFIGFRSTLRESEWVAIENQWGEFTLHDICSTPYGHPFSTVFGSKEKPGLPTYNDEDDPNIETLRLLNYRYIRFVFHPFKDKFLMSGNFKDHSWESVKSLKIGLDSEERQRRAQVFGYNLIDIERKSVPQLLVDEVLHPFYIFQIASLILWSCDEYYYYATSIFLISIISIVTTLLDTRATMRRLREISRFECDVRVLRSGFWRSIPSGEMVPGDVYEVSDPALTQFPCDSLLLAGDCIVNESMLTGESVPVSKIPATDETLQILELSANSVHPSTAKHFLFGGTKIVRARRPQGGQDDEAVALGVVLRTGFNTTKGALVRSMLFPKPSGFKFYRDSFRYISVMGIVAAFGFVISLINFVHLHLPWSKIIIRALDLITIVVPPALPATLTIGTNFALSRLKKFQIFCISPQRINVGGKIDLVCFDKTGTLTEDGLDILGVRVVYPSSMTFSDLLQDSASLLPGTLYERDPTVDYSIQKAVLYSMATCHSLHVVADSLVGDPLDFKMFDFTGWVFEEGGQRTDAAEGDEQNKYAPSVARPPSGLEYDIEESEDGSKQPIELGILKSFEFVSQLRRASVVVRQFGNQGGDIYVKGAPESMREICRSESFPNDFDDLLHYYTHRGYRVIACATKALSKLSWATVQEMTRAEAESDLNFIGFIIFENKLKESTTEIIDELNEASIRSVMCTGDNVLTAISVARECHVVDRTAHCFVPYFTDGDSTDPKATLKWQSVDNPVYELDKESLLPLPPPSDADASLPYEVTNLRNFSLAVTGDVFRWIVEHGNADLLKRMLACGQVFARMSPDEKHELVEKFQGIDYCTGFCGDGANDCGALKAADVGISLSEAEASVAAPFTSRVFDISCVPQVIREGRAALVTSFSCFKYMSLYSAIQFATVSFLYASGSNLGDFQFLFIDLILILPIAIFMGWTGAYATLSKKKPTASLVSRKVLTPLLGQIMLCVLIQVIAYVSVQQQSWYLPPQPPGEDVNIENSQNTALFLLTCFQYILSGIVLSKGPPFRQSMTENLPFVITIVATVLFSMYMLFDPAEAVASFMQLTYMSIPFKVFVLVLAAGGFVCAYIAERNAFVWLAKVIGVAHDRMWPHRKKKRKEYKLLLEELRM